MPEVFLLIPSDYLFIGTNTSECVQDGEGYILIPLQSPMGSVRGEYSIFYVDDHSVKLNSCHVGYYYSGGCINHLMYADDLVIMSPSVAGLYKLIHICESFGLSHYVLFNHKTSTIIIIIIIIVVFICIAPYLRN